MKTYLLSPVPFGLDYSGGLSPPPEYLKVIYIRNMLGSLAAETSISICRTMAKT
jgi:hypothetical protein